MVMDGNGGDAAAGAIAAAAAADDDDSDDDDDDDDNWASDDGDDTRDDYDHAVTIHTHAMLISGDNCYLAETIRGNNVCNAEQTANGCYCKDSLAGEGDGYYTARCFCPGKLWCANMRCVCDTHVIMCM